jgi:hypothetical protein
VLHERFFQLNDGLVALSGDDVSLELDLCAPLDKFDRFAMEMLLLPCSVENIHTCNSSRGPCQRSREVRDIRLVGFVASEDVTFNVCTVEP